MKKLAALTLFLALAAAAGPAAAEHPEGAQPRDIQRLQDDLDNLDDALAALDSRNPRHTELTGRADELREDVVFLRVQMRRHQRSSGEGLGASLAEVEDLRRQIAELRDDVDVAANRRYTGSDAQLPAGTDLVVRLDQPLSSRTARPEDQVEASVIRPVSLDGRIVIPAGSRVRGTVRAAEPAQRPARGGKLDIVFDSLWLSDNSRVELRSRVVSIEENLDRSTAGRKAGMGALLGAVLGQAMGGRRGALLGLIVGGAGGAISSKGDDVDLPEGTILNLQLERPVTVRPTFTRR